MHPEVACAWRSGIFRVKVDFASAHPAADIRDAAQRSGLTRQRAPNTLLPLSSGGARGGQCHASS